MVEVVEQVLGCVSIEWVVVVEEGVQRPWLIVWNISPGYPLTMPLNVQSQQVVCNQIQKDGYLGEIGMAEGTREWPRRCYVSVLISHVAENVGLSVKQV